MKGITPIGGIVGHSEQPGIVGQTEHSAFIGIIPTGGIVGWGNIMGFSGTIIHM